MKEGEEISPLPAGLCGNDCDQRIAVKRLRLCICPRKIAVRGQVLGIPELRTGFERGQIFDGILMDDLANDLGIRDIRKRRGTSRDRSASAVDGCGDVGERVHPRCVDGGLVRKQVTGEHMRHIGTSCRICAGRINRNEVFAARSYGRTVRGRGRSERCSAEIMGIKHLSLLQQIFLVEDRRQVGVKHFVVVLGIPYNIEVIGIEGLQKAVFVVKIGSILHLHKHIPDFFRDCLRLQSVLRFCIIGNNRKFKGSILRAAVLNHAHEGIHKLLLEYSARLRDLFLHNRTELIVIGRVHPCAFGKVLIGVQTDLPEFVGGDLLLLRSNNRLRRKNIGVVRVPYAGIENIHVRENVLVVIHTAIRAVSGREGIIKPPQVVAVHIVQPIGIEQCVVEFIRIHLTVECCHDFLLFFWLLARPSECAHADRIGKVVSEICQSDLIASVRLRNNGLEQVAHLRARCVNICGNVTCGRGKARAFSVTCQILVNIKHFLEHIKRSHVL
nr:MAG TPA: hypothetical protein [Bacteriophage sp.]